MDESRLVEPLTCDNCRAETMLMNDKLVRVKGVILKENGQNLKGKLSVFKFFHLFSIISYSMCTVKNEPYVHGNICNSITHQNNLTNFNLILRQLNIN